MKKSSEHAFISKRDIALVTGMPGLLSISWLMPRRLWPGLCAKIAPFAVPKMFNSPEKMQTRIADILGATPGMPEAHDIVEQLVCEQLIMILEVLRFYRPGHWRPDIELAGLEHYEHAVAEGKGVIFWFSAFTHIALVAKAALAEDGISFSHLSKPDHGISITPFGVRFINPIQIRAENKHISERVVFNPANPGLALLKLARVVGKGDAVSITAARSRHKNAARPVKVPFFDSQFAFAQGPTLLARKTGAALLPVFVQRQDPVRYRVEIGANLNVTAPGHEQPAAEDLIRNYAAELIEHVKKDPGQWRGWLQA